MHIFDEKYNRIPKAELHCHLEGSIRTQTIIDIAREHGLKLPAWESRELDRYVKVRQQMRDLQSVLDAFHIAQNCFISPQAVERVAFELFEDAASQNIHLFEVRFSPDWAFSDVGLDWDAALEALLRAKALAEGQFDIVIGLIAITSRGRGVQSCESTVDWAIRHRDQIHGIDLADGEREHPIRDFVQPVLRAKDAGLKVTVHTGEDTPAATVMETILAVNPDRIGHGIHIIEDLAVVAQVAERGIPLEVNPWSNYLTNSVPTIEAHPLKQLFDLGVKVTINSDDPQILDTNLNHEYYLAHEILGMSLADIAACNGVAVEASFLPMETRQAVLARHFSGYF